MKKIILLIVFTTILTGCKNKEKEESKKITETNGMISYTIDGEKTDIKPTKEDGYIVNKIICDNGSDMMWDNDNWEIELTKINSKDRCKVDFTKDINKEGYRVTITSNMTSALDSLSKATTLNGTIKIYSKSKIENVTGCNEIIEDNKVIISNVNTNQTCNIEVEDKTLAGIIKVSYNADVNRKRTDFSVIDNGTHADTPSGLTGGLYAAKDDQGITYYFSGDGSGMNNWVSFAGKYWRIIRINGNGSVRLLYAGDGDKGNVYNNYNGVGRSSYSINNETYLHPAYVGWMYDINGTNGRGNTPSGAYKTVENWYITNIINKGLKNYVDTNAIYCNDRNLADENSYNINSNFFYAIYSRFIITNGIPTLNCNVGDRFYNFGLMMADEIVLAGGLYMTNSPKTYYYLAKDGTSSITGDHTWWTMTPVSFVSGSYGGATIAYISGSPNHGELSGTRVENVKVIRPVISLRPIVQVTGGDGSGNNPYTVEMPS